jgi:ribosomal protein S18 acetylase RimI-like enzyme
MLVRPAAPADDPWRLALLNEHFGSPIVVGHGVVYDAGALPALVCIGSAGDRAGVVSYQITEGQLEIVSIDAKTPRQGTGTALLEAAVSVARSRGCRRAWLVTTNDNLDALRFYQRRSWRLVQVNRGAVDVARVLKPQIPTVGGYGIEIHDEIELEYLLAG